MRDTHEIGRGSYRGRGKNETKLHEPPDTRNRGEDGGSPHRRLCARKEVSRTCVALLIKIASRPRPLTRSVRERGRLCGLEVCKVNILSGQPQTTVFVVSHGRAVVIKMGIGQGCVPFKLSGRW